MTLGVEKLKSLLSVGGGPTEDSLKRFLFAADLAPAMQEEDIWPEICEFAISVDEDHDIAAEFKRDIRAGRSMRGAMLDNYIIAAIAAVRLGVHKNEPLLAWAAAGKHEFPGWSDGLEFETATMHFLQWAGADVSMPDPDTSMTALHYMSSFGHSKGSDPRTVARLLGGGASVSARNKNGDTPMAYLCGISVWGEAQQATFKLLLRAGADPLEPSNDGSTPIDLLEKVQGLSPAPLRQALLDSLKSDIAACKPGFFTRMVGAKRAPEWKASLAA